MSCSGYLVLLYLPRFSSILPVFIPSSSSLIPHTWLWKVSFPLRCSHSRCLVSNSPPPTQPAPFRTLPCLVMRLDLAMLYIGDCPISALPLPSCISPFCPSISASWYIMQIEISNFSSQASQQTSIYICISSSVIYSLAFQNLQPYFHIHSALSMINEYFVLGSNFYVWS